MSMSKAARAVLIAPDKQLREAGKGISSGSLKEKVSKNYAKLKKKADSHLPLTAKTKE